MFAWINFQCKDDEIPGGYVADYGEWYGDRGNGMIYGWDCDLSEDGMWNVGWLLRHELLHADDRPIRLRGAVGRVLRVPGLLVGL